MTSYCFTTDQKALLAEAGVRGWYQAILDFPGQKEQAERTVTAKCVLDELRAQVCCIPRDDTLYHLLVCGAWEAFYTTMPQTVDERLMAHLVLKVKPMETEEARAFLHRTFSDEGFGAQEVIDDLYARYQAAVASIRVSANQACDVL